MDPERLLTEGIDIINSVADVAGVDFALHLCRGNNKGYYVGEGGYDAVAKKVFTRARNFSRFLLEYDDWRSGSFEPLRDIPTDKGVVLGLISTKRIELEPRDEIVQTHRRGDRRYFPREQTRAIDAMRLRHGVGGQSDSGIDAGSEVAAGRRHRASSLEIGRILGRAENVAPILPRYCGGEKQGSVLVIAYSYTRPSYLNVPTPLAKFIVKETRRFSSAESFGSAGAYAR